MNEILNEILEIQNTANRFCVISKATFGEYNIRDIQTNTSWSSNPYGEEYAVVPSEMVMAILETRGFVDIELNEDGTEVVAFTALEIPEIPEPETELTLEDRVAELEEALILTDETAVELYEMTLAQEEVNMAQDEALVEIYEALGGM